MAFKLTYQNKALADLEEIFESLGIIIWQPRHASRRPLKTTLKVVSCNDAIVFHETCALPKTSKPKSTITERVRKHRQSLKRAGMRPIQIWVPDTRSPKFAEECRRQSLLIANDTREKEIMGWIEKATEENDWGNWEG